MTGCHYFQKTPVILNFRCDNEAQPQRVGGHNEVLEIEATDFFVGQYKRDTQRATQYRWVLWQRNTADVMCIPAALLDRNTLISAIHATAIQDSIIVVDDYGPYGGQMVVVNEFLCQFPNYPVSSCLILLSIREL